MTTLRSHCPWDARQTHRSLVQYLIEETLEVVEAIEGDDPTHLREELGDLLLQVVFHAEIAREDPAGFDLEDVARGIADKLVNRHPHVFGPAPAARTDPSGDPGTDPSADPASAESDLLAELNVTWEQRKAVEKGRSSVLEGIPDQLSAMAKASKIIGRARARGVAVALPTEPVGPEELGDLVLDLVARAQAGGIDPEQAVRDAVRRLESTVLAAEADGRVGAAAPCLSAPGAHTQSTNPVEDDDGTR
jgi:XTP/dITP diphosphohydrolase